MDERDWSEQEIAEAKRLAEGDYGDFVAKYPLRFAVPVAITTWDEKPHKNVRSATLTLANLPERQVGITCQHVIESYRRRLQGNGRTTFQAGQVELDILDRLIDEDDALDVATLDLSNIERFNDTEELPIGIEFHKPRRWPPEVVSTAEAVHIAGFPEVFRAPKPPHHMDFKTLALAGQPVRSVYSSRLGIQFERQYWVGSGLGRDLTNLSGMSGSPVFVTRGEQIEYFELVGIFFAFSPEYDIALARATTVIAQDGSINRDWTDDRFPSA